MFLNSRVLALLLAITISLLTTILLYSLGITLPGRLILSFLITLITSFILILIALNYFFIRDIKKLNQWLEGISLEEDIPDDDPPTGRVYLINKLSGNLFSYAKDLKDEINELKKMETYRKEFLADVSHELKTPLFAAQGFVHTLLDGAVKDKNVRNKFLKKAAKSLAGLDKLVQDLLTISQMEAGSIKMHFFNFNFYTLVEDVFEQFEGKADKKDLRLCFSDSSPHEVMVYADRERIYQVMINLIANGIKYTTEKGGKVMVDISKNEKVAIVQVVDDGIGIPPDDINRIFERFYRVDKSRSKDKGGTGLGLAIVKHILEAHKQKVIVSSIMGKGSTFKFALPLAKSEPSGSDEPEAPARLHAEE